MNITKNFVIGITTYIKYDYLDKLLDDIHNQTIWPKEIIISDNGSNYLLKKKYNIPITIVKNAYNFGTTRGANQIIKLSNQSHIFFMCDDNYFIKNTSLEQIYNTFIYENTINKKHLILCSNWASFFASFEWVNTFGLFDEKLWPCYYDDSDICERIIKHPNNNILNTIFSYELKLNYNNTYLNNIGCSESEVVGNRHATCAPVINNIYNDMISRTGLYFMEKWKNSNVLNESDVLNIHDNTKNKYVDVNEIDFKENHLNFIRGNIKGYNIKNKENEISLFVDDILKLKEFSFNKIIEFKSKNTYVSQILLHTNPKEFIFYEDKYKFHHDFCYHINYIMNYNITIKVLFTDDVVKNDCDLLIFNFSDIEYKNVFNFIDAKYLLTFSLNKLEFENFESTYIVYKNNIYMELFKKIKDI